MSIVRFMQKVAKEHAWRQSLHRGTEDSSTGATIHVMPVPEGWSPEQAWEAFKRGDLPLPEPPQGWAIIETRGGEFVRLHPPEEGVCPKCGGSNVDPDIGDGPCPECEGGF